jgi:hypothetical protein
MNGAIVVVVVVSAAAIRKLVQTGSLSILCSHIFKYYFYTTI